jgi:hypothetical protein
MPIIGVTGSQNTKGFLQPSAPTSVSVTDVGTARAFNNGSVSVAFTPGAGTPATTFEVYDSSTNALVSSGASSPIVITGLATGATASYYVKGVNSVGASPASATASATVTTVPSAPTSVTMSKNTGTIGSVNYSFAASSSNGGKAISGYNQTGIGSRTDAPGSYTITGLSQSTNYTVSVTATNANGTSTASTASATSSGYVCPSGGSSGGSSTCTVGANATTNYTFDCPAGWYAITGCRNGPTQASCGPNGVGWNASNSGRCCQTDTPNGLPRTTQVSCYAYSTQYSCSVGTLSGSNCTYPASIG